MKGRAAAMLQNQNMWIMAGVKVLSAGLHGLAPKTVTGAENSRKGMEANALSIREPARAAS